MKKSQKKWAFAIAAVILLIGATAHFQNTAIAAECLSVEVPECPCTPDCQPGDEWCTCPESCVD